MSEGPAAVESGGWIHNLSVQQADSTTTSVRARLESVAPDSFTDTIFVTKDGSWTKLVRWLTTAARAKGIKIAGAVGQAVSHFASGGLDWRLYKARGWSKKRGPHVA